MIIIIQQLCLKRVWDLKMTLIAIVVDAPGTVPKTLEKRLGELGIWERVETIKTTAILRSAEIFRRVLETWVVSCLGFMAYQPL